MAILLLLWMIVIMEIVVLFSAMATKVTAAGK